MHCRKHGDIDCQSKLQGAVTLMILIAVSRRSLTSGDLDGLAHVGAVQLPQQHQLSSLQAQDVLLLGLSHSHLQALSVQVHCTPKTWFSQPVDYIFSSHLGLIRCLTLIVRVSTQHHSMHSQRNLDTLTPSSWFMHLYSRTAGKTEEGMRL